MHSLIEYYGARVNDIVELTTTLANFETPTSSKPHVDALANWIEAHLKSLGAAVTRHPRENVGDILLAKWNADKAGKPIVFLMHMDTVWPVGTLESRPVHVEGDRLIGPGVWDMKGSIASVLSALKGLQDRSEFPDRPVWALFTSDEETGSSNSWELIEETAKQAGLCLVMEFAATNNGLKTWRKGVAHYTITIKGKSSHAGNAPEKGINAVVEFAHQTLKITELNALDLGTSVSVTVVHGGTATNVIPAEATGKIDVRFKTKAEAERVDRALKSLTPVLAGAEVTVELGTSRPPMERDVTMERSFAQAQQLAAKLGHELPEEGSGGGSDGNITAAVGAPTLDGLGFMGEGAHAAHEQAVISSIPFRTALLDRIVAEWQF
ncbi:MAG: M20 family metallopeptidase [Anaerolineae bacterium]|nr:M20 family metallopeptidase [Anaerolineae bacterium]